MNKKNTYIKVKDVIQIDKDLLEKISDLIDEQESEKLRPILVDLHPADIAEIINQVDLGEAKYVFDLLDTETAGEVVIDVDDGLREKILSDIDTEKLLDIVEELDSDDATDIVSDLPEDVAEEVLGKIDPEDSQDVKELLKYPEESAGGIMNSDYVSVLDSATVGDAINEVRKNAEEFEHIYIVYVLDDAEKLLGFVKLKSLVIHPPEKPIRHVMEEDLIYTNVDMDQEEVANLMYKYDLVAIPVVDVNKKMLGRITIDDVVDVIQEEAAEDIQKMAGLSDDEEVTYSTVKISRNRLPWLFVALVGNLISAVVLSNFEASLKEIIVASFFIPIVMAMGGSAGSQAAIVMVQGMGSSDIWYHDTIRKLSKEFRVALLNGFISSVVLFLASYIFFPSSVNFSLILSASLMIIMVNATMIGAIAPLIFKKLGSDPAIATGPFVATANDVMGLLIYFTLITIFYVA